MINESNLNDNVVKTGTTTIGLVCSDGIVLAADKRATAGYMVVDPKAQKIHKLTDNIALTIAGSVSDAQLILKLMKANIRLINLNTAREVFVKEIAHLLSGIVYGKIREMSMIQSISEFILGGKDKDGFHLYDIFPDGSLTEIPNFISSGSGSVMAYGVLETMYKKGMSVNEGTELAIKAIKSALRRDIATGNGIQVINITKDGVKTVYDGKIDPAEVVNLSDKEKQ